MNPEALRFDDACAEQDWLRSLEREPDPAVDTSTSEARRENHCGVSQAEVDAHIDKVMRELKACKSKMMLLHHYTTKRRTTPSGDPINPVFFCMQNPSLEEKIDGLSVETQIKFYDSLDEKLNLTHPRPSRDHLQSYMRDFASAAIAGAIPSRVPCEDPDVATAVVSDIENQQGTPEEGWLSGEDHSQMTSHNREHSPGDPSVAPDQQDSSYDETSADDDDDDDDDYSTENPIEIPVQPDDPPADEPEFADEPFTVYEGNMFEVLSVYLKEKPHYRLVSSTLEELRGARKTCYLECRRSISSRNERLEPKKGSKPDWRLWPTFTCPLKRVKVSFREGRCMFYPLRLVGATAEEWRNHEHYPGTESCRSATIPPDVVDDWIVALSSRPCSTNGELKKMAMQKNISGGYCAQTTEFLTQRGLGNYEAVRAVIRSIKESKDCGLSVTAFTRSLMEMACGADMLRGEVSEIIGGLDALERGTHSSIELNLARKADCCLVLEDILCESQPGVDDLTVMSLRSYSAVITSPRMLRNLRGCYTMGIDATFNLTHADLKLGVICSLPKTSTAQPIAIVIMTQESTECIEHALKQLTDAAAHLKMLGGVPREVVLDGSAAIHAAVMSHYGGAEESQPHCISCYFHVLKRAKDCKAKVRLSTSLWLEIKKDLALLGEAHSRKDWLRLRELFMKKWTEGEWIVSL
ncbi:hypothetical protein Pmar_PMAR003173 [Perkinsus marinus ATCC 50983]|uniref:MULE transposase domain-containing protein n=1 Tax=Perkinsus marinus (strain ATCC 50983 / TXsc) TaxID=423536 RepID=C5L1Q8_PERM5|nr:hypothetical protein Pmar_PMAR003173 [Perkinsus marinus ATCC 50983]EER09325.1 hypothetical protein Pmar_PMAR003173 [Perkinsus marinus ATCC 50983]|eukprot:XP_002777509.1 hypothetical protein Pmar_PMAR003173 [Perkinsus marinus ATCC 50983]